MLKNLKSIHTSIWICMIMPVFIDDDSDIVNDAKMIMGILLFVKERR